ncbi:MAG: metal-dependent hydrolase [Candidatus Bathyarchaeota archaeon]
MIELRWLGHSAFEISSKKLVIYVDPYISGNPEAPVKVEEIRKANYILVTHDHFDHLGDAVTIAKNTGSKIVVVPELAGKLGGEGVGVIALNMGSMIKLEEDFSVGMVQAFHTSTVGAPVGFVFTVSGKTFYHAGDTCLFGDMKLIGEVYKPEVALLPIGGYYTMGPKEAAVATLLLKPKVAIPMHYKTFPVLEQNAEKFLNEVRRVSPEVKVVVLKPGEKFKLEV